MEDLLSVCPPQKLNGGLHRNVRGGGSRHCQTVRETRPPQEEQGRSSLREDCPSASTDRQEVQIDQGSNAASASDMASNLQLYHLGNGDCHHVTRDVGTQ